MGYETDTTPSAMTSACLSMDKSAIMLWVTSPEAIGLSSTAVTGTGMSLRRQGIECRRAKTSVIQDPEAPESTKAKVFMGFLLGKRRVTLMKK